MAKNRRRSQRGSRTPWGVWAAVAAAAVVVIALAVALRPQPKTYRALADPAKPTLIFVYTEPNPSHPYG